MFTRVNFIVIVTLLPFAASQNGQHNSNGHLPSVDFHQPPTQPPSQPRFALVCFPPRQLKGDNHYYPFQYAFRPPRTRPTYHANKPYQGDRVHLVPPPRPRYSLYDQGEGYIQDHEGYYSPHQLPFSWPWHERDGFYPHPRERYLPSRRPTYRSYPGRYEFNPTPRYFPYYLEDLEDIQDLGRYNSPRQLPFPWPSSHHDDDDDDEGYYDRNEFYPQPKERSFTSRRPTYHNYPLSLRYNDYWSKAYPLEYACPATYDPVCGSDGKTYANTCDLGRYVRQSGKWVYVVSRGPCEGSQCPNISEPVCASDGRTYRNECQMEEYSRRTGKPLSVVRRGGCNEGRCNCSKTYLPLCGSDGQTYNNLCELDCWNRISGEGVYVAAPGPCQTGCNCKPSNKSVCASNGHTFNSACDLDCYNRRTGQDLYVAHEGICEGCRCGVVYQPVCASDNNTYANLCEMNCHGNKTQTPLTVKWNGTCADGPCKCPSTGSPVCASDGNTYGSQCMLDCINRYRPSENKLLTVFNGTCARRNCYWSRGTNCSSL